MATPAQESMTTAFRICDFRPLKSNP